MASQREVAIQVTVLRRAVYLAFLTPELAVPDASEAVRRDCPTSARTEGSVRSCARPGRWGGTESARRALAAHLEVMAWELPAGQLDASVYA